MLQDDTILHLILKSIVNNSLTSLKGYTYSKVKVKLNSKFNVATQIRLIITFLIHLRLN